MTKEEDIRPPGSVTIRCSVPGCGTAWWVDPLDPQVHDPAPTCGADHEGENVLDGILTRLQVTEGLTYGQRRWLDGERPATWSKCWIPTDRGIVLFHNRDFTASAEVAYHSFDELRAVTAASLPWAPDQWPWDHPPEPGLSWARGYTDLSRGGQLRYAVPRPCQRPGCKQRTWIDLAEPHYRSTYHSMGSEGVKWVVWPWEDYITCDSTICTPREGTPPCALVNGVAQPLLRRLDAEGKGWTHWLKSGLIFFNRREGRAGVLLDPSLNAFLYDQPIVWLGFYRGETPTQLIAQARRRGETRPS